MNCPEGEHVHAHVSLSQGHAHGQGVGAGRYKGGLASYPVSVPAKGRASFEPGLADAALEAVVHDRGRVVDHETWEETVELMAPARKGHGGRHHHGNHHHGGRH